MSMRSNLLVCLWVLCSATFAVSAASQIELPDRPIERPPAPVKQEPAPARPADATQPAQTTGATPQAPSVDSQDLPQRPKNSLAEQVLGASPYVPPPLQGEPLQRGGLDLPSQPPRSQASGAGGAGGGAAAGKTPGIRGATQTGGAATPTPQGERGLELPGGSALPIVANPAPRGAGAAQRPPGASETFAVPASNLTSEARANAARFILEELAAVRNPSHSLVEHAARSLIGLGDQGFLAARAALDSKHGPTVVASARTLLRSPDAGDRMLVHQRLRGRMPNNACAAMVAAFVTLDPVSANPKALAALLDHPQSGVRASAQRALEANPEGQALEDLVPNLASSRTDTRLRTLDLIHQLHNERSLSFVIGRLSDHSAQVASRAVRMLAATDDPRIVDELPRLAFASPWILRENAYAILALIEREDVRFEKLIDERRVTALLEGTRVSDPFVAGTCAAALAGIGFRSEELDDVAWLDTSVPNLLVKAVSGVVYHDDFSSLSHAATRRLALITGKSFGNDGPAWLKWWASEFEGFHSRRAAIRARVEDAPSLSVTWSSRDLSGDESFRLIGPLLHIDASGVENKAPRPTYLTANQALDLFGLLEREGLFGASRLPGARAGVTANSMRELEIEVDGRVKSFAFPAGSEEPWFAKVAAAVSSLHDRNRWQAFHDPLKYPRRYDLFVEDAVWWDGETDPQLRDVRLKENVLLALPLTDPAQRDAGVAELERLYESPGVLSSEDLPRLLALLEREPYLGPRARGLVRLALAHVDRCASLTQSLPEGETAPVSEPRRPEQVNEPAHDTVRSLAAAFGERAADEVARVLERAGPDFARALCADESPILRTFAAEGLAANADPADVPLLIALLDDPAESVEAQAVRALGGFASEQARGALLIRARIAQPQVRAAALEAIGDLGGEDVLDALVFGLADRDPQLRLAAARGVARMHDPRTTQLLVSLLAQGRSAEVYAPAREGLLALGELVWEDLLRSIASPAYRGKREATILLAEQGVPDAAPLLMRILTDNPSDAWAATELAVLTCVDLRSTGNPAGRWFEWWDGVVHDDSLAWFRAALEREGVSAPPAEAFQDGGSREAVQFLIDVMGRTEPHIVERARREFGRLAGRSLDPLPPPGPGRDTWLRELRERALERRE